MRVFSAVLLFCNVLSASAFTVPAVSHAASTRVCISHKQPCLLAVASAETEEAEAETEAEPETPEIPVPKLESEVGVDYMPLVESLKTGDLWEADAFTRNILITLAGEGATKRDFVYFSEVAAIPSADLATVERCWKAYSDNKFGYSVQKKIFESPKCNQVFDKFFDAIGWKNDQGQLRRWTLLEGNEFIYDVDKAPKGHFPLTSALRGTRLLEYIFLHPVWESEEFGLGSK